MAKEVPSARRIRAGAGILSEPTKTNAEEVERGTRTLEGIELHAAKFLTETFKNLVAARQKYLEAKKSARAVLRELRRSLKRGRISSQDLLGSQDNSPRTRVMIIPFWCSA